MPKPRPRTRFDFWHALDVVSSALLLGIALANSLRLWQSFAGPSSTWLQVASYWLLPIGFELAKNCFFASGVREVQSFRLKKAATPPNEPRPRGGGLAAALFTASLCFSFFSLTGSAMALLAESSAEGAVVAQAAAEEDSLKDELAGIPDELARQSRVIDTYDQSYRDYAQVVAAASAEKARLEARRDELRARLAAGTKAVTSTSGGAFYTIVRAFGVEASRAQVLASKLRLFFMGGVTVGVEYGGLFLLAVALSGRRRRDPAGSLPERSYVYAPLLRMNHIAAPGASPGRTETLCGKVFALAPQASCGEGSVCPDCLAKERLDA